MKSLSLPLEYRIRSYIDYYGSENCIVTDSYSQAMSYKNRENVEKIFIYTGQDVESVRKNCLHINYTLSNSSLIMIPRTEKNLKYNFYINRLKIGDNYNMNEALMTKKRFQELLNKKFTKVENFLHIGSINFAGENEEEYPFDTIDISFDKMSMLTEVCLKYTGKDFENFLDDFFSLSDNEIYIQEYNHKKVFRNLKYNIAFPHDDAENIRNVYSQRFKNMKNLIYSEKPVLLLYVSRWEPVSDSSSVSYFMSMINSINKNVYLYGINIGDNNKSNCVNNYTIEYKEEYRNNSWSYEHCEYDNEVFKVMLQTKLREVKNNASIKNNAQKIMPKNNT